MVKSSQNSLSFDRVTKIKHYVEFNPAFIYGFMSLTDKVIIHTDLY